MACYEDGKQVNTQNAYLESGSNPIMILGGVGFYSLAVWRAIKWNDLNNSASLARALGRSSTARSFENKASKEGYSTLGAALIGTFFVLVGLKNQKHIVLPDGTRFRASIQPTPTLPGVRVALNF